MRVIGGELRGRKLATPQGSDTRPTSDRVRGAIFNKLQHGLLSDGLDGARVLDLFAGSGALGIEALSRGAAYAVFLETAPAARGVIRENVERCGLTGVARIFRRDATRPGAAGTLDPFDLVFCDPPYAQSLGEAALAALAAGGWLAPQAICVLEEKRGLKIAPPDRFAELDRAAYGDTEVYFWRWQPSRGA
ncbi:MAG: 16S rRNA (guanine(966)-N(2))-methyltransferase RsmD [Pseudomonadota bacterium]